MSDCWCSYGFFYGGDPRHFEPDFESATEEEQGRYKSDCKEWDDGNPLDRGPDHKVGAPPEGVTPDSALSSGGVVLHYHKASYGLGLNMCEVCIETQDRRAGQADP